MKFPSLLLIVGLFALLLLLPTTSSAPQEATPDTPGAAATDSAEYADFEDGSGEPTVTVRKRTGAGTRRLVTTTVAGDSGEDGEAGGSVTTRVGGGGGRRVSSVTGSSGEETGGSQTTRVGGGVRRVSSGTAGVADSGEESSSGGSRAAGSGGGRAIGGGSASGSGNGNSGAGSGARGSSSGSGGGVSDSDKNQRGGPRASGSALASPNPNALGGDAVSNGGAANSATPGTPSNGNGGGGFVDDAKKIVKDHLPIVIVCAILLLILIVVLCTSIKIMCMLRRKPNIKTISEQFQKMKDVEAAKSPEAKPFLKPQTPEEYYSKNPPVDETPHVHVVGTGSSRSKPKPARKTLQDSIPPTTLASVPILLANEEPKMPFGNFPDKESDDRLKQIEKEIRDLENSMNILPGSSSFDSPYENFGNRPDKFNFMNNPDQYRDLENLSRKPEAVKQIDNITNKPEALKDLENIVASNDSKQLRNIHTIVKHPTQLDQMTELVKKPDELNKMTNLMGKPPNLGSSQDSFEQLEKLAEAATAPSPTPTPTHVRQLSEKSEAIAKLDAILEKFSEMDNFGKPDPGNDPYDEASGLVSPRNISEAARRQARMPSGVLAPSRGAVAVLPVPGFKRSSREHLPESYYGNPGDSLPRTRPTISLASNKVAGRPQFPSTYRRLAPPAETIAFGSRVSNTPPVPLKAGGGRTSSSGRQLVYSSIPLSEYDSGHESDMTMSVDRRINRRVQFSPGGAETGSNQELRL